MLKGLLRRLLGAPSFLDVSSSLDRPSQRHIGRQDEDGWGRLDGSWFEDKLFSYKDPLDYAVVTIEDLAHGRHDIVWHDKAATPYPSVLEFHHFHDQADRPVIDVITSKLPSIRPAAYIMARSDVALSGYRTFIGRDGQYNLDESFTTKEIAQIETARLGHPEVYRNELIGFMDTAEPSIFRLETKNKKFAELKGPVICLSSNEAPNYGSFIFRIFPKLIHVAKLHKRLKLLVPMYCPGLKSFLEMAGIEENRIIPQYLDHVYYLERAIVPSMRNRDLWLDDETLAFYDGIRARYGVPQGNKRIYVTRRSYRDSAAATGRVMTNEAGLIAELQERGFEIVEPEKLSPLQQIRTFSSASVIVGAGGSALFNTVFCHPGTKLIDIEAEPHWVGGHSRLFKSCGLDYGIFEGTPVAYDFSTPHIAFSVDIPRLRRRLAMFLR